MTGRIVIVGASLTGATAAATLRAEGFDSDVVLIGAEPEPPYERPLLSKAYPRGDKHPEDLLVRPLGFCEDSGIETRLATVVTRVDLATRGVELAGGERIGYDKLLLATGGRNRRLPIPGRDLDGIHDLRGDLGSDPPPNGARPATSRNG